MASLRTCEPLPWQEREVYGELSALSGQARSEMIAINTNSRLLLENYGGFLPRQGHEYAKQKKEAAAQMERPKQWLPKKTALEFPNPLSGILCSLAQLTSPGPVFESKLK